VSVEKCATVQCYDCGVVVQASGKIGLVTDTAATHPVLTGQASTPIRRYGK
jgi:hypothetical protein